MLGNGALGAALGMLFTPRTFAWTRKSKRVVVIGAGASGLAAARTLQGAGVDALVLEARSRMGGRIWTDRSLGVAVDLGASWIHGVEGNPIASLAASWDLAVKPTNYDSLALFDANGTRVSDADLEEVGAAAEALMQDVEAVIDRADADMSVGAALDEALAGESLSAEDRRVLDWYVGTLETTAAADLWQLSASGDDGEDLSGGDFAFVDGYHGVVEGLGKGLTVHLEHVVERIEHGKDGVRVHVKGRDTIEADAAIVTLPLGVLKRGSVTFEPALPEAKQRAIDRLHMGVLDKVALAFAERFWDKDAEFLSYISERGSASEIAHSDCSQCHDAPKLVSGPVFPTILNESFYKQKHALVGFAGGPFAARLESLSDHDAQALLMKTLRTMYGRKVPEPTAFVRSAWHLDPFAGGAYPYVPVGVTAAEMDALAEPVGDRLFFAGDATNRDYSSTVHGAYLSGVREAKRLL